MTVDPPLLMAQLARICSGENSPSYVDFSHIQAKFLSSEERENLIMHLRKHITKITKIFETSIIMHILLAFLTLHPPTIVFWHYLSGSDHNLALADKTPDDDVQDSLNSCLAFLTLGVLIFSYLFACWLTDSGIKRFKWAFLVINIFAGINLGFEAYSIPFVFSRVVVMFLRFLLLTFNGLLIVQAFKVGNVYKELIAGDKPGPDIELQQYRALESGDDRKDSAYDLP